MDAQKRAIFARVVVLFRRLGGWYFSFFFRVREHAPPKTNFRCVHEQRGGFPFFPPNSSGVVSRTGHACTHARTHAHAPTTERRRTTRRVVRRRGWLDVITSGQGNTERTLTAASPPPLCFPIATPLQGGRPKRRSGLLFLILLVPSPLLSSSSSCFCTRTFHIMTVEAPTTTNRLRVV